MSLPKTLQPIEFQYNPEVEPDDITLEVRDLPLKRSETPEGKRLVLSQSKVLIGKFLKPDIEVNFGQQISIAKRLLKKWPYSLFEALDLTFKLNSLAWFMTPNGITELRKTKNLLTLQERLDNRAAMTNNRVSSSNVKVGEDSKIISKPKSVMDFIKVSKHD